jgi:hypothetical protein
MTDAGIGEQIIDKSVMRAKVAGHCRQLLARFVSSGIGGIGGYPAIECSLVGRGAIRRVKAGEPRLGVHVIPAQAGIQFDDHK